MDQPAAALDMINRFMYNKNLADEDDIVTSTQQQQQSAAAGALRQSLKLPAESQGLAVV
jgi:hypothetical protein